MSNLHKITNEDIIDSGAFSGGSYGDANKEAVESVGNVDAVADTLVRRTEFGGIRCLEFDCPALEANASSVGFFGKSPVAQPSVIESPAAIVGFNDNDIENAIVELQDKVDGILTVLKDLGLVAS